MSVPTYGLYGEDPAESRLFWLHCETIVSRSSTYRFEIALHRHESFLQFLYIRSGAGDVVLEDGTITLQPPCVVVIPPGPAHGFRFSRDIDGLVVTIATRLVREPLRSVTDDALGRLSDPLMVPLDQDTADPSYFQATFARIVTEHQLDTPQDDILLELHVAAIVVMLLRRALPTLGTQPETLAELRVRQFKDLIVRHLRDHLPAEAYARQLGVSPTHLNRMARLVTGKTAHELIMDRLMDEACRELVFTGYSIQQVAENLGFSDAAYFCRVFRSRIGLTPKTYRDQEIARMRNKEV